MRWVITQIGVLKPIRFVSFKRNELQSKISPRNVSRWMEDPSQYEPVAAGAGQDTDGTPRNSLLLRDVAYIIEAYPLVFNDGADNTPQKYIAMMNRRVEKGQCYQRPALGCREFAANFEPATDSDAPIPVTEELGRMLYDIVFSADGNRPVFFSARLENGILNTRPESVLADKARKEVLACSYKRS